MGLWQLGVSMAMGDLHGSGPLVGSRVFSSWWGFVGLWWVCDCWASRWLWGHRRLFSPWLWVWYLRDLDVGGLRRSVAVGVSVAVGP